jgi:hypothetical protein
MQLSSAPAKIVEAWAINGQKNTIPVPSQIPITPGAASWNDGFPPLTMLAPTDGGIGPSGLDMNGLGFSLSSPIVWFCAGAGFPYDATFSSAVGGYPKGARVLAATGVGYWLSTVDNNTTDPDTGGAGWSLTGAAVSSSVYASAQQTLATGNPKVIFNTVEFDEGLWNEANSAFIPIFAGKYRVSGSVLIAAPSGQELATLIFHNGALAKQCFQAPQVSTGNLSMPFDAIINCAVADTLAVQMSVPSAAVLAGMSSGSNQPYVFAQCSYLGA